MKVVVPVVEAAGVLVEGAVVAEGVGLKLKLVVAGVVVDDVLGCDEVAAGVEPVAEGKLIVKPAVVLAAGVVVERLAAVVLVVEGVGLKENEGVVVLAAGVEVVDVAGVVDPAVVLAPEAGVVLKLKLVVAGAVVEVVLGCEEELAVVPAVGVNENEGVAEVVAVVLEAAGVVVLAVDGCDELAVGKENETAGVLEVVAAVVADPVLVDAGVVVAGIARSNKGF